jgi:AcrR family transcriptional regulator
MNSTSTSVAPPRERILAAAVKIFAIDGYTAGSVNDVAAGAGMSRHNLLYYFRTKRDLLTAVLDSRDEANDRRLQWLERSSSLTLSQFADELVALLPVVYADRELMQLYHRLAAEAADPSHPAHQWVKERYRRVRSATRFILSSAQDRNELSPGSDVDGLALALLGAIEGIETQWLVDPDLEWQTATNALRALILSAEPK